eukprot:scaffold3210_cov223-Chaetoceros_neogracile.AAC.1
MLGVDESTRRLMELTSQQIRNEDDIDEIITLIQEKAPKLLDALSDANKEKIALHCFLKTYGKNKAVFHQGDVPDTYYTILRGAVSIFAKTSDAASLEINDSRAKEYGRFLMQLPPGASFGELSFNADHDHSKRHTGVISDGNHGGQTRVQVQSSLLKNDSDQSEAFASSNVAVLLSIPEKTYMDTLYTRHASKHQIKEKITFLKSLILFDNWPYNELIEMTYGMKKKIFKKGTVIAKQGDRLESVVMILKGKIKVAQRLNIGTKSQGVIREEANVELAELECNDMFGILEVVLGSMKKIKREALASSTVEAYVIQ